MNRHQSRPLAILSAPGSRGDVNPMVAIGRALKTRGYDVAISLAEPYAPVADAAGLQTHCLIDQTQFDGMLADPRMWSVFSGMRRVIGGIAAGFLKPHFELIRQLHRPGRTVLVAHPLDLAARIFRDLDPSTPHVGVHLAPVMIRNPDHPARLTSWRFEPTRNRRTFRLAYWLGDALILDRLLAGPVNRIRREQGLDPIRRVMNQWWHSPDRILACYPSWFAPSTVGPLPQLRHVGFPLSDGSDEPFEQPTDRPVVFTGGSANWHTRRFFQQASLVCQSLGRSGILLGSESSCFPSELPSTVRAQTYAPLGKLLPHCSAIVHHGGIGTMSQALRWGVPQIIRPLAFDQFDNADRMVALGCGVCLQNDRDLAGSLQSVLNDRLIAESAALIRSRFENVDGPTGDGPTVDGPTVDGAWEAAEQIDAVMIARTGQV